MKTIIYQGVPGSNSHTVARNYFGRDANYVGREAKFSRICSEFTNGSYDFLVLPIENTLAGSVYENYDHLYGHNFYITAELRHRVQHYLLSRSAAISEIRKVYSHPKALEQCEIFFEKYPKIEEVAVHDTAGAALMVSKKTSSTIAAIASPEAARLYNLPVLKKNVEDDHRNFTRFFVLSKTPVTDTNANKASLIFTTSHKPGSLFRAIKTFADHRLNLTKIESRPLPKNPFEYFFYVDFEFSSNHRSVAEDAVAELKKMTRSLKLLGYYTRK